MNRLLPLMKIGAILFLTVLLLAPMAHIRSLIRERQALRDGVLADVARSAGYAQTLTGPVLVVPYVRTVRTQRYDPAARAQITETHEEPGELRLLPATLQVNGTLGTEERRRGIYRARVFHADATLAGRFEIPAHFGVEGAAADYRFGTPHLALGISDIRGIGNALALTANGTRVPFLPGTGTALLAAGVQAPLALAASAMPQALDYAVALALQGTGEFHVVPVGRETQVTLKSDWPHPSFVGEFLPHARTVDAGGFSADWRTSFFATNLNEALARCQPDIPAAGAEGRGNDPCAEFRGRTFGVAFIDPVDQYLKSERAAKYAFLFIGLTFAGFFLAEVLRRVSVHPVQYGLVGLALAMFFLLLIAFAEHIGFGSAYLVSAAACVGLVTYYVTHVLGSRAQGAGFGVALASLYGLLYGILSSEDYALLMGSLLVFGLLALVMVLTRGVSWHALGAGRQS